MLIWGNTWELQMGLDAEWTRTYVCWLYCVSRLEDDNRTYISIDFEICESRQIFAALNVI